jgi:hypothetical protein
MISLFNDLCIFGTTDNKMETIYIKIGKEDNEKYMNLFSTACKKNPSQKEDNQENDGITIQGSIL